MELAKKVLDEGFYISFSGIITFKKVGDLIDVVKYVPLDRILVETDAPFLAPMPFRGKRNEPSFVTHTLKKIAKIKRKNVKDMAQITTDNFFNLFSNLS
jgi:TatD DNase family protein